MHPFWLVIFVSLGLPSCSQNRFHRDSMPTGKNSLVDPLMEPPQPASSETLGRVFQNLGQQLRKAVACGRPAAMDTSHRKEVTRGLFLKQIRDVQGIPRSQAEVLLMTLAADKTGQCGELHCATVMGVTPHDVPAFLDETHAKLARDTELAKPKNKALHDTLLSSLARFHKTNPRLDPAAAVSHIAAQQAIPWPKAAWKPEPLLSAKDIMKILPHSDRMAITNFTISGFGDIRLFQNSTNRELLAQGWTGQEIKQAAAVSKAIDNAIELLPRHMSPVYRGINKITPEQVAYLVWCWKQQVPIGLGPKNLPAVASTSWDPHMAKDFIRSKWNPAWDQNYGIVLVIKGNHGGASIENISYIERQREVLLPSWVSFDIEKISPVIDEERMLVIELRAKTFKALDQAF